MDPQSLDTAIKFGKELGVPALVLAIFAYFMVYKIFPAFLARDKEKDDANREERKTFIDELGKITEKTNSITKNFESSISLHKETLIIMKDQNKDIISQVSKSHKDLTETIKADLLDVKKSLTEKIDSMLKELSPKQDK